MSPNSFTDQPRLLRNNLAIEARLAQLQEPHVKPLTLFVEALRSEVGSPNIPYFDPWDGGINAECLFLLEAPSGKAVLSNFISRNNNDKTAENFFILNREAGLSRACTITWNVVPWYIGSETKIRHPNNKDIADGFRHLVHLLELLPKLRAVVLLGRKAEQVKSNFSHLKPELEFFPSPHPSSLYVNRAPDNINHILEILIRVAHFINTRGKIV